MTNIKFWSGLPLRECFDSNSDSASRLSSDPSQSTGPNDSVGASKLSAEERGDMDTLVFDESICRIRFFFPSKAFFLKNKKMSLYIYFFSRLSLICLLHFFFGLVCHWLWVFRLIYSASESQAIGQFVSRGLFTRAEYDNDSDDDQESVTSSSSSSVSDSLLIDGDDPGHDPEFEAPRQIAELLAMLQERGNNSEIWQRVSWTKTEKEKKSAAQVDSVVNLHSFYLSPAALEAARLSCFSPRQRGRLAAFGVLGPAGSEAVNRIGGRRDQAVRLWVAESTPEAAHVRRSRRLRVR